MQLYDAQGQPKPREIPLPLADGQLPTSQTAIYTSPASTKTRVRKFTLFNNNAAAQTIDLWININAARKFRRVVLLQNESADVLAGEEEIILDGADTIEALTTTASAVDYYLGGETWK